MDNCVTETANVRSKPALIPLSAFWFAINFQQAALITILIPTALDRLHYAEHTVLLAQLVTVGDLVALLAPPLVGMWSDRMRRRGIRRRGLILAGALADTVGLASGGSTHSLWILACSFLLAILGMTAAGTAFQAIMPEIVSPNEWGRASGFMGVASLLGNALGLVSAGVLPAAGAYISMIAVALCAAAYTARTVPEPRRFTPPAAERHVSLRAGAFYWVFAARLLVLFGQTLLMTFVLYFFQDVLHVHSPAKSTALMAILALAGASAAALGMGLLSDRIESRARIVALASLPMAGATTAFGLTHSLAWVMGYAVVYGLGYGAFLSVDWALALDTMPSLDNVARNLGVWGMAAALPAVVAPAAGGLLLSRAASPAEGYESLFWLAGLAIFAGAAVVWMADRQHDVSLLSIGLSFAVAGILLTAVHVRCRVRVWGRLPFRRKATLVVSNHTNDLDSMFIPARLFLAGPWHRRILSVGSRRLFESRFLAIRAPKAFRRPLALIRVGAILRTLGVCPIEDSPRSRPLTSYAQEAIAQFGDMPPGELLTDEVYQEFKRSTGNRLRQDSLRALLAPAALGYTGRRFPLSALREPYRSAFRARMRTDLKAQSESIRTLMRRGHTVFVTPEGRLTATGETGRLRWILDELLPAADQVFLASVSYDPLSPGRLPLFCRIVRPRPGVDMRICLAAARTLTVSQLIAKTLCDDQVDHRGEAAEIAARALRLLDSLPPGAFLEPALRRRPAAAIGRVLRRLEKRGHVTRTAAGLSPRRPLRDRRFPHVQDMWSYLCRQWSETEEALHALAAAD